MKPRRNQGSRPQVTFTSDFHELVQGDLVPGPCLLRYDPLRIVALADAAGGHHINAHVRFHPLGTEWQGSLFLPGGLPLADLADISGQGLMLETTFNIPEGCDELEVWFSCVNPAGHVHWDSDFGNNHRLRFGLADLTLDLAAISKDEDAAHDELVFKCTTPAKIEAVSIRWRITSVVAHTRQITPLVCASNNSGTKTWSSPPGGIPVPKGVSVVFDVVYSVGGRSFTDDNQGRWYIVD